MKLTSEKIYLAKLTEYNATQEYANWLNDLAVNQFLESRHTEHTIESCRQYIFNINESNDNWLFGIFTKENDTHIGNIKLTLSSEKYQVGEVGVLIGNKSYWEKGIGTLAIGLITKFGFDTIGLKKIEAGCYEKNLGSLRCFLKCGYTVEGFIRSNVELDGKRMGTFRMGILPS